MEEKKKRQNTKKQTKKERYRAVTLDFEQKRYFLRLTSPTFSALSKFILLDLPSLVHIIKIKGPMR